MVGGPIYKKNVSAERVLAKNEKKIIGKEGEEEKKMLHPRKLPKSEKTEDCGGYSGKGAKGEKEWAHGGPGASLG